MNKKQYETVIIGSSQAGLATAYHLSRRNRPFIILDENDEVGAAWRKRWTSLRLFTPARYDSLPGMPFPGDPNAYPGKNDVADYLRDYASHFGFRVENGVRVTKVKANGDGYSIETDNGPYSAQHVVVATGAFHHPKIPGFAAELSKDIGQVHSSQYRGPLQISEGPVLVVGAGQSGAEIALDMARDHHKVWLSGRSTGDEPIVRGTFKARLLTPIVAFAVTRLINVSNPLGRKLRKHFFYPPRGIPRAGGTEKLLQKAGVDCVERTAGVLDGYPVLEDGEVLKVKNVIWCTGFMRNYSWIDLPIFDEYGIPYHRKGVVQSHPGLYFMGLPFQRTLSSTLIMGVDRDARYIARHIASMPARTFSRESIRAKAAWAEG